MPVAYWLTEYAAIASDESAIQIHAAGASGAASPHGTRVRSGLQKLVGRHVRERIDGAIGADSGLAPVHMRGTHVTVSPGPGVSLHARRAGLFSLYSP